MMIIMKFRSNNVMSLMNLDSLHKSYCLVKAGTFRMGTTLAQKAILAAQKIKVWDDEQPAHSVSIAEFAIGKNLVTNSDYMHFVQEDGYHQQKYWPSNGWHWRISNSSEVDLSFLHEEERVMWLDERAKWNDHLASRPLQLRDRPFWWEDKLWNGANFPVVGITWYEAEAYCNWLTEKLRLNNVVEKPVIARLPTEAEWEYAAKVDASQENSLWPWGNEWDANKCNCKENGPGKTTPVGFYPEGSTANGINDLIGNVWEWCHDWWRETIYRQKNRINPFGPFFGRAKVKRGGSWASDSSNARSGCRDRETPSGFFTYVGFRVVLTEMVGRSFQSAHHSLIDQSAVTNLKVS